MLTIALLCLLFLIGVACGAYGHKWLASATHAPDNLPKTVAELSAITRAEFDKIQNEFKKL